MNNCKYLSKKINGTLKCKFYKKDINNGYICKNCSDFILKRNKAIKKISNKRIFVSQETYQKVFQRDKGKCRLLDKTCLGKLELHHILYRSERKDLIDEPSNCICLCTFHHKLVHSNKKKYQPILLKMLENK